MNSALPSPAVALALLRAGRTDDAIAMARVALAAHGETSGWLSILALSLSAARKPEEALPLYRRLTELEPQIGTHWSNLGNCICELDRPEEALPALRKAVDLGIEDDAVHFGLARAYAATGPAHTALAHIRHALAFVPRDTEYRLLLIRLLLVTDEWQEAGAEIEEVQALPLDTEQEIELGFLMLRNAQYEDALRAFDAATIKMPDNFDAASGAVLALERLNRIEAAVERRAKMKAGPATIGGKSADTLMQVDARLAMRAGQPELAAQHLRALLAQPIADPALEIGLRFDYAAAADRSGDVHEAMRALDAGHRLYIQRAEIDRPDLMSRDSLFGALDEPQPRWSHATSAPGESEEISRSDADTAASQPSPADPIFVVGFPRSGTTLLEQLLDAHSRLKSFDEQPFALRLTERLRGGHSSLQEALDASTSEDRARLRQAYFDDVAEVVKLEDGAWPVDKNPLNLVRLPLLQGFFPRSKAILALRHPCDVVLSCYMQNFRAPALALSFRTLETTAAMYDRVFSCWWSMKDALALPVHWLRYEDFVAHTETEARRLFEFLRLPWEDDVLAFTQRAKHKGKISTPSYSQVIEGVNNRAVGRWNAYREYFDDSVLRHLAPWIERLGYR